MKEARREFLAQGLSNSIKKAKLAVKITLCVLAALMITLVVALIIDIVGMTIKYTLEAGDMLPSAVVLSGRSNAKYDFGELTEESFALPGEYEIYIDAGNRRFKVKLEVVDTTPPKAELIALYVNQGGPYPTAIDFFKNIEDASDVTARFVNGIDTAELGEYEMKIELSDEYGNKRNYKTLMTVIVDTVPPTISAPATITSYIGEAVAYRKDVVITDNCFGEVRVDIDSSAVNTSKKGTYKVTYTATDAAGNISTATVNIQIVDQGIASGDLMERIGQLAQSLGITKDMTKEEQVKRIYKYVNSPHLGAMDANIVFNNQSNTDRSDWRQEALLTLERGKGDCYSYFAVSKAFFEYFGIENRDIERSKGVTTQEGTHFWSMVNIGTSSAPKWYYYDATRLAKYHKTGSGCLFTEKQRVDYNTNVNPGFLTFDKTGYPATPDTPINTGYRW